MDIFIITLTAIKYYTRKVMSKLLSIRIKSNCLSLYLFGYGFRIIFGEKTYLENVNLLNDIKVNRIKKSLVNDIFSFRGIKVYVPNFPLDCIQSNFVLNKQFFEIEILEKINKYLNKDSVVFDLGANVGNHTLYWALKQKVKKVYSFEPVPNTFKILEKNIEINKLQDTVNIFNFGLSDKTQMADIDSFMPTNIGATHLKVLSSGSIQLKDLDSVEIKEDYIDFVKIDIEGMEIDCLNGAKSFIEKYHPLFLIEAHAGNFNIIQKMLSCFGYILIEQFPGENYLFKYN